MENLALEAGQISYYKYVFSLLSSMFDIFLISKVFI